MVYAKIHADKLYRMGQINGQNIKFEAGETRVLELTDEVEQYVDNANALELLDTADTAEELTDSDEGQGETQDETQDGESKKGDASTSNGDEADQDESDADDETGYGERLRDVEGVGDSRAEQIEEFANDEEELVNFLESGDTDSLPDQVVANLKAEFL